MVETVGDVAARIAAEVAGDVDGVVAKAAALVRWVHGHVVWMESKVGPPRSVSRVLADGFGSCGDINHVLWGLCETQGIAVRTVSEVGLLAPNALRGAFAASEVRRRGDRASLNGSRHGEYRWLEIGTESGDWIPADPCLGVCGLDAWVRARLMRTGSNAAGCGDRLPLLPLALVLVRDHGCVGRSEPYLVEGWDAVDSGGLHRLPGWPAWRRAVCSVEPLVLGAMDGRVNLHRHLDRLADTVAAYRDLCSQARSVGGRAPLRVADAVRS